MQLSCKFRRAKPVVLEVSDQADWQLVLATLGTVMHVAEEKLILGPEMLASVSSAYAGKDITFEIEGCSHGSKLYHSVTRYIRLFAAKHPQSEAAAAEQPQKRQRKPAKVVKSDAVTEQPAEVVKSDAMPERRKSEGHGPLIEVERRNPESVADSVNPDSVTDSATDKPAVHFDRAKFNRGQLTVYVPPAADDDDSDSDKDKGSDSSSSDSSSNDGSDDGSVSVPRGSEDED